MVTIDHELIRGDYATIRRGIPSCEWDQFADLVAARRSELEAEFRNPAEHRQLSLVTAGDFQNTGILKLPFVIAPDWVAAMRRHLEPMPALMGKNYSAKGQALKPLAEVRRNSQFASYTFDQILGMPHLIDVFNYEPIVDFIEQHMGCVPTLYSTHAWWSFPAAAPEGFNAQYFHRDTDDWRFFTLFLYLTDVDSSSGPHQLIAGSHTAAGMSKLLAGAQALGRNVTDFDIKKSFASHRGEDFSMRCERLFAEHIVDVTGPAGTMFIANTLALHRGLLPAINPRLIVWARFGFGSNTNSVDHHVRPLPRSRVPTRLADTLRNRYINRMLLSFSE